MYPREARPHYCYISLYDLGIEWGRLKANESKIVEISYYGDWVNLTCSEVKQDLIKKSTLDRQYLIKECELKSKKEISWKDILINTSMPGECENCVRNVSIIKPVLWLSFDEGKGKKAYDKSGYGNDGIIYGAKWVEGKFGKALDFDGSDDYVEVQNSNILDISNAITIEAWIKNIGRSTGNIVAKFSASDYGYRLYVSQGSGKILFQVASSRNSGLVSVGGSYPITYSEWQHVVGVFDGSKIKFYEDGVLIEESDFNIINSNNQNLLIGVRSDKGEFYNGAIDEVKVYNSPLTEREIKYSYANKNLSKLIVNFHSSGNWINYKIEDPKKLEITGQSQWWGQKIILNNTLNLYFLNISIYIPSFPDIEQKELVWIKRNNATDLTYNNSQILFSTPLDVNAKNNIFEFKFSTPIEVQEQEEEKSLITGEFILTNLRVNLDWLIVVVLVIIIGIISYLYHYKLGSKK